MFERIEEIVELRDLISDLKLAHIYSAKLSKKKEELMNISYRTNAEEVHNIFNTIIIIDSEIYKNIDTINCYNKALAKLIDKLNFRKELFQQIEDYKILSPSLQDKVCKELVKVFNLYGCQYVIQKKLISLQNNNNNIRFISILNIIIDIHYENINTL